MRSAVGNVVLLGLISALTFSPLYSLKAQAQVEVNDAEMEQRGREAETGEVETGRGAAQKYFQRRQSQPRASSPRRSPAQAGDRYLSLHVGTFFDENSYSWGRSSQEDIGKFNAGVTYRIGQWVNSMDLLFRADYNAYELNEGRASKLSLLPLITFPDASSRFPLYFGGGAGLGVFFKQIPGEESLSFDYQLVAGARFFDLLEGFGVMVETGMKNHVLLLSDGQFNGVFFSIGGVFNF